MSLINFDKQKVKEQLTSQNIFDLLEEFGGNPEYTSFGIMSQTICHNDSGEGSRKLYWYSNSGLFQCFTNCGSFDIFDLTINVFKIQRSKEIDLNTAIRYVAAKCGISGEYENQDLDIPEDWRIFDSYEQIKEVERKDYSITLKEFDDTVLKNLSYNFILTPWLKENISQEVIDYAQIGYYPGLDQITIPHFDADGRFVGLRARTLAQDDAERYGKYRPMRIMDQLYNHPLGMNLYGLNWAKNAISTLGKAIIFESEKSVLKYMTYFGIENNISVACCGSSISAYHIHMLKEAGAKEIIIALDRQFQEVGDKEFLRLTQSLSKTHEKYKNEALISIIFDKNMITGYKSSPIDEGVDKFLTLFKERIYL